MCLPDRIRGVLKMNSTIKPILMVSIYRATNRRRVKHNPTRHVRNNILVLHQGFPSCLKFLHCVPRPYSDPKISLIINAGRLL